MAIRIASDNPVTVTQVTRAQKAPANRNIVTVTPEHQRILDLEARVAKLEAQLDARRILGLAADKPSRAEYMREYRKRKTDKVI